MGRQRQRRALLVGMTPLPADHRQVSHIAGVQATSTQGRPAAARRGNTWSHLNGSGSTTCAASHAIWNDMPAGDVQTPELPVGMGPFKAEDWDGSNVFGPCIVTVDEIDPHDLGVPKEQRAQGRRRRHSPREESTRTARHEPADSGCAVRARPSASVGSPDASSAA